MVHDFQPPWTAGQFEPLSARNQVCAPARRPPRCPSNPPLTRPPLTALPIAPPAQEDRRFYLGERRLARTMPRPA